MIELVLEFLSRFQVGVELENLGAECLLLFAPADLFLYEMERTFPANRSTKPSDPSLYSNYAVGPASAENRMQ